MKYFSLINKKLGLKPDEINWNPQTLSAIKEDNIYYNNMLYKSLDSNQKNNFFLDTFKSLSNRKLKEKDLMLYVATYCNYLESFNNSPFIVWANKSKITNIIKKALGIKDTNSDRFVGNIKSILTTFGVLSSNVPYLFFGEERDYSYANGISKRYWVNKETLRDLIDFFIQQQVILPNIDYKNGFTEEEKEIIKEKVEDKSTKKQKVTQKTLLVLHENQNLTDIYAGLLKQYPSYNEVALPLLEKTNVNKTLETKNKFDFKLSLNRTNTAVKKISARMSSSICNTKNADNHETLDTEEIYIQDIAKSFFGQDYFYNNDFKCSIYNLNRAIQTKKVSNIDVYDTFIRDYNNITENNLSRNKVKKGLMFQFFNSRKQNLRKTRDYFNSLDSYFSEKEIEDIATKIRSSLINIIGKPLKSEIFYYESILALMVESKLIDLGYKTLTVYDNIMTDKKVDNFEKIYAECQKEVISLYYRDNK